LERGEEGTKQRTKKKKALACLNGVRKSLLETSDGHFLPSRSIGVTEIPDAEYRIFFVKAEEQGGKEKRR